MTLLTVQSQQLICRNLKKINAARALAVVILFSLSVSPASSMAAAETAAVSEIVTDTFTPVPDGRFTPIPSISADGRYIAYLHYVDNKSNIHLYDRIAGSSKQINLTQKGLPSTGFQAHSPKISADGRYVVYSSHAADIGMPVGHSGYFVYDRINNSTETVVTGPGTQIFGNVYAAISSNGRFVAYRIEGNPSLNSTIYVRDMVSKTTQVTSASATFIQSTSDRMFISDDGRYVSYPGRLTRDSQYELLLHDRVAGTTELANINTAGVRENHPNGTRTHAMSADGNVIAFTSDSSNLSANDFNANMDVFVRDRKAGTTDRLSFTTSDLGRSGLSGVSVSADGRFVTFYGYRLENKQPGLYRYDRATKTAVRAPWKSDALTPAISADGRYVTFASGNADARPFLIATTDFGAVSGLTLSNKTLALTEGGAAATYTAVLDQAPTADVQVNITPDAQLSVAHPQLTFTPANWATPQTVSVQAVADGVVEGQHSGTVRHTVTSADPAYTVVPAAYVTATITDTRVPTIAAPATWAQPDLPVTGTATPGATVLLSAVNLASGGVTAVSVVADARGAWSWTLPGLAEGKYELQAEADGVKSLVRPVELVFAKP
ncbi:hypothetical protein, partial [Rugamonas rubra]